MGLLLTSTVFSPLIGILFLSFVKRDKTIKCVAFISSLTTFLFTIFLYLNFDSAATGFQFVERYKWFEKPDVSFYFGIDGLSLSLIILTSFLTLICLVGSWQSTRPKLKSYLMLFLIAELLVIGALSTLDLLLFYLFFEASLVPLFFIIGIWGGENRIYAAYKFFLYSLFGSIFLLITVVYILQEAHSLSLETVISFTKHLPLNTQIWLWLGLFFAFAIKIPMWPFHTWLPDAHVQAPTAGSVILAGILLKMGAYGFIRFSLPMFPEATAYFADWICVISIIGIIYSSLVAFTQTDMKKLIAYSSIAHMGYVTLGIFSGNFEGLSGAIVQMNSHGLISAGLFISVGFLSDRTHTKDLNNYGGVAKSMPIFATLLMTLVAASMAVPGTSAFIAELLSLVGAYKYNKCYAMMAVSGMVFSAVYMLKFYKKIMLGKASSSRITSMQDINFIEMGTLAPLAFLILAIGIKPSMLTELINGAVSLLIFGGAP